MKKIVPILAFMLVFFNVDAQTNYPNGIPGCIARWNFTNTGPITSLPDVSGNNNNGAAYNLTAMDGFRNLNTKAMKFNGTSSYALVPSSAMLNPSQITIISVIRFHGFYSGLCTSSQIISKGYPHFIQGNWGIGVSDNIYDGGNCNAYDPTKFQLVSQFYNGNTDSPPGNYVDTNVWYFMACSYSGNTVKYYMTVMDTSVYQNALMPINTVNNVNTPIGTNSQDVSIGKHLNPTYPYWVNGDMDELTLFNRVLSDSEIHEVYTYLWGQLTVTAPDSVSSCGNFTVDYTTYNPDIFQAGNVFTAQLSDANGSFASPVNIGNVTAISSGSITCSIPVGTPTGYGYRIRVVASNSSFTSPDNGSDIHIYTPAFLHPHLSQSGFTLSPQVNYSTYQWYWNGNPINGATNQTYTVTQNGSYFVQITDDNGCMGNSDTVTIANVGVQNVNMATPVISVYPNPAKDLLYLAYSHIANGSIVITDLAGKTVISKTLANNINISGLAKGIYLYRISNGDRVLTRGRFIKE